MTDGGPASWHYRVYGLGLKSNLELPGLEPLEAPAAGPEIEVDLGRLPVYGQEMPAHPYYADTCAEDGAQPHLVIERVGPGDHYHFTYASGFQFVLDPVHNRVWGSWGADQVSDDAVLYLVGPILGFLLRLQGVTCLHAGAVVEAGRALVVVGPSGAGKSTLTAILARRGHPVMTDDLLPLYRRSDRILARSGYPRLRLRPEVVARLYGSAEAKPRLTPSWERRYLDLAEEGLRFHHADVPLGAVYLLERDQETCAPLRVEPLTGHEGLSLLAANSYRNELLTRGMRGEEFLFLADLIGRVPVRRLRMATGLADVEEIGQRIIEDFRARIRV